MSVVRSISKEKKIVFCKKCVNPSTRPRIKCNANGICEACQNSKTKYLHIDWKERKKVLKKLLNKYRSKDGSYDIIVPTSGGKDSFFVAHKLKYEYGMNPLCINWAPSLYTDIGLTNLLKFTDQFDTIIYRPNRDLHGKLTRIGFEFYGDPLCTWTMGQQVVPLKTAIKYKIPLIMYGEDFDTEYGGKKIKKKALAEDIKLKIENINIRFKFNTHVGVNALFYLGINKKIINKNLKTKSKGLLDLYRLPTSKEYKSNKIVSCFFSNYEKWVPHHNFYYASEKCGFIPRDTRASGTYTKSTSLDDKIDELYYYMQYIKFGFGRCTTEACNDIRDDIISREEAVRLVNLYDKEFPHTHYEACLSYMDIDAAKFSKIVDKFRSPNIWKKKKDIWEQNFTLK